MTERQTLYIKRTDEDSVVSTLSDYSIGVVDIPFRPISDVKDLPTNDWHDEDGEDCYIPSGRLKYKAYDMDVKLAYVGEAGYIYDNITEFLNYIAGADGIGELSVYSPYTQIGRKCRFTRFNNESLYLDTNEEILEFTITLRVIDPITNVTLTV